MRVIAETSLSDRERARLDRFVAELRERLGDELHAVRLYGSRARGKAPAYEDSDVDVLVEDASSRGRDRVYAALRGAGRQLGDTETDIWFSLSVASYANAWQATETEAREVLALAHQFVEAVQAMFESPAERE